ESDKVYIADRSRKPFTVTTQQLADARGRTEHNKYKLISIGVPDMNRLPDAIIEGIRACIDLFQNGIDKQGFRGRFGFAGLQKWADDLTSIKDKERWNKLFPPGAPMYAALTSLYEFIETRGTGGSASRDMYADFLDEATVILNIADLKNAARHFRKSADAWRHLANMLLPDDVPLLKETRELILQKDRLFVEKGQQSVDEIQRISSRMDEIKNEAAKNFPLNEVYTYNLREAFREQIIVLLELEKEAVSVLANVINDTL
ncbi:MAG TPA: DUF4872 domain-containing protein, partial [Aggregatilineales bacterium]|nr:DUF4872 domain-containing protein [Aggregatilineales bacterium]